MNYINVEIGGKNRGLKFNQLAIIILSQKADTDNYAATANYAMVYAGLKANCYVKEVEADFTYEDVCDWVDALPQETLTAIDNCLAETQVYKDLVERAKGDEVVSKKKSKKDLQSKWK